MSDLDTTQGNPVIRSTPRIRKDALGNARLARSRETQAPDPLPELHPADWERLRIPPG